MKTGMIATLAGLAVAGASQAAFVGYVVTSANVSNSGQNLVRYEVFARFNGATDTVLNAFNLRTAGTNTLSAADAGGFWHKDQAENNSGALSQAYGTWSPSAVGSTTTNRPFDSFLLIGGNTGLTNATNADPSWGGASWNTAQLPVLNPSELGWFNSNPPNNQGRVGIAPNTATDVKLAQFVLSQGDTAPRVYSLTIGFNNGQGGAVEFGTSTFALPAPGAIALLGLAGLAGRRRR